MSSRLITIVTILSLTVGAVACGSDSGEITLSGPSAETPGDKSPTTLPDDSGTGDIPGLEDLPDVGDIPGVGAELEECLQLSTALATMIGSMSGAETDPAAQKQVDEAKATLPADVRKDFETLAKGYAKFADGDIVAASAFLNSKAYRDASDRVTKYADKICSDQPGG